MLKMTKAKQQAPAPAYVPTDLIIPNEDEVKNGYTAEKLTPGYVVDGLPPIEQARQRLVRARHRARLARKSVEVQKRASGMWSGGGENSPVLRRLEKIAYEAEADEQHAEGLWDVACEELS